MKTSELIAKLQELIATKGDLEAFRGDEEGACPIEEVLVQSTKEMGYPEEGEDGIAIW